MHTPGRLHYTAVALKTICTLITLTFLTGALQLMIIDIQRVFFETSPSGNTDDDLSESEIKQKEIFNSSRKFTLDGTLCLVNHNMNNNGPMNRENITVKDRNGHLLFSGSPTDNPHEFIHWPSEKSRSFDTVIDTMYLENYCLSYSGFTKSFAVPTVNSENKRTGHWIWNMEYSIFTYYDIAGQCGGHLGKNGYSILPQEAEPFEKCFDIMVWLKPKSYNPMMLFHSFYAVYQIDFYNKTTESLVASPNDPILSMNTNNWEEKETSKYRPVLSATTKSHKFILQLKNPNRTITTQLPDDFFNYSYHHPDLVVVGDRIWAQYQHDKSMPKTRNEHIRWSWLEENWYKNKNYQLNLWEIDQNGTFHKNNTFAFTYPAHKTEYDRYTRMKAFGLVVNSISSPLPRLIFEQLDKNNNLRYHDRPSYVFKILNFFFSISKTNWPVTLCCLGTLALLTLLHGRPRQASALRLGFWVGFVCLFNLAGFLTYLTLNHTPVARCASCGKRRGLEQDACCRCGAALPLPVSRETDLITKLSA